MRIFAQLQGGRVHWIFTAEECPPFAPYIEIVEITGMDPMPQEGWLYRSGNFVPPPGQVGTPSLGQAVTYSMGQVGTHAQGQAGTPGIAVFRAPGAPLLPSHQHDGAHLLFVIKGKVKVTIGTEISELNAPSAMYLPGRIPHAAEGLTPDALILSVFPEQMG